MMDEFIERLINKIDGEEYMARDKAVAGDSDAHMHGVKALAFRECLDLLSEMGLNNGL